MAKKKIKEETKKVICRHCKGSGNLFYNLLYSPGKWPWCEMTKKVKNEFTGVVQKIGPRERNAIKKQELNQFGNCRFYKKKWWKFWVKQ